MFSYIPVIGAEESTEITETIETNVIEEMLALSRLEIEGVQLSRDFVTNEAFSFYANAATQMND
jgi:hypothetical protein